MTDFKDGDKVRYRIENEGQIRQLGGFLFLETNERVPRYLLLDEPNLTLEPTLKTDIAAALGIEQEVSE